MSADLIMNIDEEKSNGAIKRSNALKWLKLSIIHDKLIVPNGTDENECPDCGASGITMIGDEERFCDCDYGHRAMYIADIFNYTIHGYMNYMGISI